MPADVAGHTGDEDRWLHFALGGKDCEGELGVCVEINIMIEFRTTRVLCGPVLILPLFRPDPMP